jgi:hypothetical protein
VGRFEGVAFAFRVGTQTRCRQAHRPRSKGTMEQILKEITEHARRYRHEDDYRARYEQDYVEITTPRDRVLKREAIEREEKFKETVRQLYERIRLK